MRTPRRHLADDGTVTWRVRYRIGGLGGVETSETFRREADADTFAAILGNGRGDRVTEALAWLEGKRHETGIPTFGEWFETWASQLTGITQRTRADYRAMHRRYLTSLDRLPLPLVSRAHVAGLVNGMEADGYSPKTIKHVFNLLSSVLTVAQGDGLIPRNPVTRVRLPRVRRRDNDRVFLSHEEAGLLVAATESHYRPLVVFLLGTGLRWSEVTALQCRHVDLVNGTVRVERAWKRVPGGSEIGVPKSDASRRTVNAAVPALAVVAPLMAGRKPSDLVFTTPGGNVVRHGNFYNRVWRPACEKAELDPRPTIHDCRSTFGSWMLSEGTPLEAVQDQLGHESYDVTRKVYAHLLPSVGVAAGKAASDALARALASAETALPLGPPEPRALP